MLSARAGFGSSKCLDMARRPGAGTFGISLVPGPVGQLVLRAALVECNEEKEVELKDRQAARGGKEHKGLRITPIICFALLGCLVDTRFGSGSTWQMVCEVLFFACWRRAVTICGATWSA